MVFQSYALYPHMTVYDNIAFPLKAQGVDKASIPERVERAAAMFGIERFLKRKPRELSGGERQRVALARAMVREPTLFLLDEPLSNLDAKLRTLARDELKQFQRRIGTTTIYVTHDQIEAMGLGDRIVVMCGGKVRQIGSPQEVYDKPADTFVAGFLGSPPMNLLAGRRLHRRIPARAVPAARGARVAGGTGPPLVPREPGRGPRLGPAPLRNAPRHVSEREGDREPPLHGPLPRRRRRGVRVRHQGEETSSFSTRRPAAGRSPVGSGRNVEADSGRSPGAPDGYRIRPQAGGRREVARPRDARAGHHLHRCADRVSPASRPLLQRQQRDGRKLWLALIRGPRQLPQRHREPDLSPRLVEHARLRAGIPVLRYRSWRGFSPSPSRGNSAGSGSSA